MQLPRPTRAEREDAAWLARAAVPEVRTQPPAAASDGGDKDLGVADDASAKWG
jgi:hypothetical protein